MPTQTTNTVERSTLPRTLVPVTSTLFVVVMIVVAATQSIGQEVPLSKAATRDQEVLRKQFEDNMKRLRESKANSGTDNSDEADPEIMRESRPVRSASNSRRSTSFDGDSGIQRAAFQQESDSVGTSQASQSPASPLRSTPNETHEETSSVGATDADAIKPGELFLDLSKEQTATATASSEKSEAKNKAAASGSASPGSAVSSSASPVHILTRAVAWIVVALCLLSLTVLGVRRWQRQRGLLPTTNARSRVLETLSLGPGRTVSLIELAGFRALVASDAGGIRSLVLAPTSFQDEFANADKELNYDPVTLTEV